jgi:hypothetical protein
MAMVIKQMGLTVLTQYAVIDPTWMAAIRHFMSRSLYFTQFSHDDQNKVAESVMLTTRNKIYEFSLQPLIAIEFCKWIRSRYKQDSPFFPLTTQKEENTSEEKKTVTNQSRLAVIQVTNSFNSRKK